MMEGSCQDCVRNFRDIAGWWYEIMLYVLGMENEVYEQKEVRKQPYGEQVSQKCGQA